MAALARWLPRLLKVARSTPGTCCTNLCCARWAQGVLPMRWGLTATHFDLPSLAPLSVAGRGRLQLGVAHWATSVALLQVVEIWPHKLWKSILLWGTPGQMRLYLFLRSPCLLNLYSDEILVKYEHFEFDVDSLITCWFRKCVKLLTSVN